MKTPIVHWITPHGGPYCYCHSKKGLTITAYRTDVTCQRCLRRMFAWGHIKKTLTRLGGSFTLGS